MVGVEIVSGEIIFKMSGSGNDFIFIDGRASPIVRWPPDRIRDVCTHGSGVGADGLIVLEPGSAPGHVGFTFFNRFYYFYINCWFAYWRFYRLLYWLYCNRFFSSNFRACWDSLCNWITYFIP